MRKTIFENGGYYHIYNRGVDKRKIFNGTEDYFRFLKSMKEFNTIEPIGSLYEKYIRDRQVERGLSPRFGDLVPKKPIVEIIAYCLNPNHFHLILKQLSDGGISKFMLKLCSGYTTYFNKKFNRSGSLFQSTFKSIHITNNDYLLQLSCYINGNPEIHEIAKAENYRWSSYSDYLGKRSDGISNKKIILQQVENIREYKELVSDVIKNSKEIKDEFKQCLLE